MKVTVIVIVVGALRMVPKSLGKKIEGTGNQRKSQDHSNHSIVKISENT